MSYEGYLQCICENGHYYECDVDSDTVCFCNTECAYENMVDQTNGSDQGIILKEEIDKLIIVPAKVETCNLGYKHEITPAIYRIPTREEMDSFRLYFDEETEFF